MYQPDRNRTIEMIEESRKAYEAAMEEATREANACFSATVYYLTTLDGRDEIGIAAVVELSGLPTDVVASLEDARRASGEVEDG